MSVRALAWILVGLNVLLLVVGFYTLAKNQRLLAENLAIRADYDRAWAALYDTLTKAFEAGFRCGQSGEDATACATRNAEMLKRSLKGRGL